jgi:hypothetical protein
MTLQLSFLAILLFSIVTGFSSCTQAAGVEPVLPTVAGNEKLIFKGEFRNADKTGSGTAGVYQKEDGKRVLRLTNFKTDSGPDLLVYVFDKSAKDLKKAEFVSLGRLKNKSGDQEYEIPANLDLESFSKISIWCRAFSVNFADASLVEVS